MITTKDQRRDQRRRNRDVDIPTFTYYIENLLDGKLYIGYTNNPKKRWREHRTTAKDGTKASLTRYYIHNAMAKHGVDNFVFVPFACYKNNAEAQAAERYWIAEMKAQGIALYNLTDGGDGVTLGASLTEEHKANISKALKALYATRPHGSLGRKHSEETKQLLREHAGNDKRFSPDEIETMRQQHFVEGITTTILAAEYGVARKATVAEAIYGRNAYKDNPIDLEKWGQYMPGHKLLTPEKKDEIRAKYDSGAYDSYEDLGLEYRISGGAVWRIVKRLNKADQ